MRATIPCVLVLIGLTPALAAGQSPVPSQPAKSAVDVTKTDLDAAMKIGIAALNVLALSK